jgi:hypothetical protein
MELGQRAIIVVAKHLIAFAEGVARGRHSVAHAVDPHRTAWDEHT